jgi:hypothetical protein
MTMAGYVDTRASFKAMVRGNELPEAYRRVVDRGTIMTNLMTHATPLEIPQARRRRATG